MAREAGRRCQRCDFAWFAMPPGGSPGKPRWFDEAGSFWTDGQARMSRRTANYDRHLSAKDRWEVCPNCGSRSVVTDKSRDFRPTGAVVPAPAQPAPHAEPLVTPGAQPSPSRMPVTPSKPSIWQQLGKFHAKHWRIIWAVVFALAPLGSLGEDGVDTGNTALTALAVGGIFVGFWVVAGVFALLHLRHRQSGNEDH